MKDITDSFVEYLLTKKETAEMTNVRRLCNDVSDDGLKPCPFCGEQPDTVEEFHIEETTYVQIQCTNIHCPVETTLMLPKEEAYKVWNTRKGEYISATRAVRKIASELRTAATHVPADTETVLDILGLYPGEYIDGFDPVSVIELADILAAE